MSGGRIMPYGKELTIHRNIIGVADMIFAAPTEG